MSALERWETRGLFPDLFDLLESPLTMLRPLTGTAGQAIRVEEYVDEDRYVIRAELPDADLDKDVEITISNGVLGIHAERHAERKETYRSEFRYGSFTRSFRLPADVRAEDVKATYDKGILEIIVPMPEVKEESQRITVEKR